MSYKWEIDMFGIVVTRAPEDVLARSASFIFTGSPKTRAWVDSRNVPMAVLLGDFETLCR
jgi:hypothetical protein